jgi:hypothetical protein
MRHPTPARFSLLFLSVVLVSACGGGGGGEVAPELPSTGSLSVAITDAPVHDVAEVNVQFTGVSVKPADGNAIDFTFDVPKDINLLALTDANSADLLNGERLEAGAYNWIRLQVNAEADGVPDSFVIVDAGGGMVELVVPSQRGLQLSSGFTITRNQTTSFIIDWDLNKGLVAPSGQGNSAGSTVWKLRPSLRITDLTSFGSISGVVANTLVDADSCTTNPAEDAGNSIYIYEGADVTPDDIHTDDEGIPINAVGAPLATAQVKMTENGGYDYLATFLAPGDYTVAFTCQGLDDTSEEDDPIVFSATANATVVDDEEFIAELIETPVAQ